MGNALVAYVFVGFEAIASAVDNSTDGKGRVAEFGQGEAPRLQLQLDGEEAPSVMVAWDPGPEVVLAPGQCRGWWNENKPDQRVKARAIVNGSVDDHPARILLDSGANISILTMRAAKRWSLRKLRRSNTTLTIQGLSEQKLAAQMRVWVKVTLGWSVVYSFEVWVGDHNGGCDLILGTDFLMSAGVCLDLYRGRVCLPDEVVVPLEAQLKFESAYMEPRLIARPGRDMIITPAGMCSFIVRRPKKMSDPVLWVTRFNELLPRIELSLKGVPKRVHVFNPTSKYKSVSAHDEIAVWMEADVLPWKQGYVRANSRAYQDWQILIGEIEPSREMVQREVQEYEKWLAAQPCPVERPEYELPKALLIRPVSQRAKGVEVESTRSALIMSAMEGSQDDVNDVNEYTAEARLSYFVSSAVDQLVMDDDCMDFVKGGCEVYAEDLDAGLAIIPELKDPEPIDFDAIKIGEDDVSAQDKEKMRDIIKKYGSIFEDGGNAAPPQARGTLCDIDVGGAQPIAQRARKVKPEYLEKLHELLKALLKNGLIQFSRSAWASPIVIVLKKNKKDIRLCIDYRAINALTKQMIAAMPVVDEMLMNFGAVMWCFSFDACSGFWTVGMTRRAREISAFICPLGHFEWLRMPQGLMNAPSIYQRMLDNALWGFVKPKGGWNNLAVECDAQGVELDMFENGEIEDEVVRPIISRRSYIDDIQFGSNSWPDACEMLEKFLRRMTQCNISLSLPKSEFGRRKIEALSHWMSGDGVEPKPKDLDGLMKLAFPTTKKGLQSFLGTLNY